MSNADYDVKQIFDQALEIDDSQARQAWMESVCAGQPELLCQVAALLRAFVQAGDFLQKPIRVTVDDPTALAVEAVPEMIATEPQSLGRFQIQHELGRGGSGVVFKAFDPSLKRDVALKIPRGEGLVSSDARQRFLREAEAAAGLDHPHLVPVYDVGEAGSVCFIASAYCAGSDLAKWQRERNEPVDARLAATLVAVLANAIDHAHSRGVLHRDLKPSNILLFPDPMPAAIPGGEALPFTPRIADFGLAKLVESSWEETRTSVILGTPLFMAPEQATGRESDSRPHADIYSLGAILYQLLTGRTPFEGPTLLTVLDRVRHDEPVPPRSRRPDVPRDLETICLKCLQKAPLDRYATAADLAAELHRFVAGEAIQARPIGLFGRIRNWSRRPDRMRDAGMLAIFLGITISIWIVFGFLGVIVQGIHENASIELVAHSAAILFGLLIPLIFIGIQSIRRNVVAMRAGLTLSIVACAISIAPLLGSPTPYSEMYDVNPFAKWMVYFFLSVVFAIESAAFVIALRAYHATAPTANEAWAD